jgi:RHS repeat-associated protein
MYDLTGSVRGLLDAAGAVTDTYALEAFGVQRSSTGTTPNPYRFGGAWGYINGVSGLQQLGARFYWPEIGRFIQQDPIGDGMNWYAYAGGNPVVFVDPKGLCGNPLTWLGAKIGDYFWPDESDPTPPSPQSPQTASRPAPSTGQQPSGGGGSTGTPQAARGMNPRGPALVAGGGAVLLGVREAGKRAGTIAGQTARNWAKAGGYALAAIGAYFTWKDAKGKADQAVGATGDKIRMEGSEDDGTWDFLNSPEVGLGTPQDNYTGYGMSRGPGSEQECPPQ